MTDTPDNRAIGSELVPDLQRLGLSKRRLTWSERLESFGLSRARPPKSIDWDAACLIAGVEFPAPATLDLPQSRWWIGETRTSLDNTRGFWLASVGGSISLLVAVSVLALGVSLNGVSRPMAGALPLLVGLLAYVTVFMVVTIFVRPTQNALTNRLRLYTARELGLLKELTPAESASTRQAVLALGPATAAPQQRQPDWLCRLFRSLKRRSGRR